MINSWLSRNPETQRNWLRSGAEIRRSWRVSQLGELRDTAWAGEVLQKMFDSSRF